MREWTIFNSFTTFYFGKYKGKKFDEVAKEDIHYIVWCFRNIYRFLLTKEDLIALQNKFAWPEEDCEVPKWAFNRFKITEQDIELLDKKWEEYDDDQEMLGNEYDHDDLYGRSTYNNPHYNDNLDMDQQDPEFWNWF